MPYLVKYHIPPVQQYHAPDTTMYGNVRTFQVLIRIRNGSYISVHRYQVPHDTLLLLLLLRVFLLK